MSLRGYKKKWERVPYEGPRARMKAALAATAAVERLAAICKRETRKAWKAGKKLAPKPRKKIRRERPELRRRRAEYRKLLPAWLALPENRTCRVWELSGAFRREKMMSGHPMRATECHHVYGRKLTRRGDLLLAFEWCAPVSREGHRWIEENPDAARELGLLAPVGKWNTWPE